MLRLSAFERHAALLDRHRAADIDDSLAIICDRCDAINDAERKRASSRGRTRRP
jgi:hypothetical protein